MLGLDSVFIADARGMIDGDIYTLLFDAAVPPKIDADDFGCHCEVEADAAAF